MSETVSGQSVLLSNLKSADEILIPERRSIRKLRSAPELRSPPKRRSAPKQRATTKQRAIPQLRAIPDRLSTADSGNPFLRPSNKPSSTPSVASILESADVDDELIPIQSPQAQSSQTQSSQASGSHEDLDALLWLRTAVEYDALTRQTFNAAVAKLGKALVDSNWNALAADERSAARLDLPPCVIVDVDETVLDNSVFQLELIQSDTQYTPDAWNSFVQRRASPAIDGAVDFVSACRASGVAVFFVTNREATVEAATRENLIDQGLMTRSDPDRILSKNEVRGWTSDKANRRQAVAEKYRVLLLIGDDLNDFVSAKNLTIPQREQVYNTHKANWGQSWFVMPNPNYGNWEQATYDYQNGATIQQKRQLKMQTLSQQE